MPHPAACAKGLRGDGGKARRLNRTRFSHFMLVTYSLGDVVAATRPVVSRTSVASQNIFFGGYSDYLSSMSPRFR